MIVLALRAGSNSGIMTWRIESGWLAMLAAVAAFRQMPIAVLHHHDRGVDQHANRQRQSAERHDVGADVQVVHRNERGDDRNRQRENRNQRGAEVKQKDDDDEADDDGLFRQDRAAAS